MDSKAVIQLQKQQAQDQPWCIQGMQTEIKSLMQQIPQKEIDHAYKETNQTADELANEAVRHQAQHPTCHTTQIWQHVCPTFLLNIVQADARGTKFPRIVNLS